MTAGTDLADEYAVAVDQSSLAFSNNELVPESCLSQPGANSGVVKLSDVHCDVSFLGATGLRRLLLMNLVDLNCCCV